MSTATDHDNQVRFLPLVTTVIVGYLSVNISPLLLGAVSDGLDLNSSRAGLLTTLEMLAFGVSTLFIGPWIPHAPKRRVAMVAAFIALFSQLLSANSSDFLVIAVARVCAGLSQGALVATAYSIIAGEKNSQSIYGNCIAITILFGVVAYLCVPILSDRYAHHGSYGFVALVIFLALPILWWLPRGAVSYEFPVASDQTRPASVGLLLAGIFLVLFSDGLVWPLSERIGQSLEFESWKIGLLLGLSVPFGALGSFTAGRIGRRFGLAIPLVVSALATAAGGILLTYAENSVTYFLGAAIKNYTLLFFVPIAIETTAILDRRGRISAIAGGIVPMGAGFGPIVAGIVLETSNYRAIGWIGAVAAMIAILLLWKVVRNIDQRLSS